MLVCSVCGQCFLDCSPGMCEWHVMAIAAHQRSLSCWLFPDFSSRIIPLERAGRGHILGRRSSSYKLIFKSHFHVRRGEDAKPRT